MAVFANYTDGSRKTLYYNLGLMDETVWGDILDSLVAENHTAEAANMNETMYARQRVWSGEADPFGSEMAWDSTGQEGVYYWSNYFHDNTTAQKTVASIRGYMPTVAHWGWNGNARRYWDFLYAGKLGRIERQIHHYGSGLNALPMLSNYRQTADPSSMEAIYDLRVGWGGIQGSGSNIDASGFGSMAFHSYPDSLFWDQYTGDYGPNFVGHILGSASYLVDHPIFGWISFGGNVALSAADGNTIVTVVPRDTVRQRIFVAPLKTYITIDAGMITSYEYQTKDSKLSLTVSPLMGSVIAPSAILAVSGSTLKPQGCAVASGGHKIEFRGSSHPQTIQFA